MHHDLNMVLMQATFKLEQGQGDGSATVGTGWLVLIRASEHGLDHDRIALVTAAHVFRRMAKKDANIHWRRKDADGTWKREPRKVQIRRSGDGPGLWVEHPERDIAVLWVEPPDEVRANAVDYGLLADAQAFERFDIRPADEMMALGYPRGITANEAGFPILRSGRIASYPLWPAASFPTFLLDFSVFAGNSGGPVYMADRVRRRVGGSVDENMQFIAGLLAQQVMLTDERLEIGIVLHSVFIREALQMLIDVSRGRTALLGPSAPN